MRDTIRQAATRVLARDGTVRFTTNRVAAVAGISVGSLYQYYPNKTALLLELYEKATYQTWAAVEAELFADCANPRKRFAQAIEYFFRTEAEWARMRTLLADAAVALSETETFAALERIIGESVERFLREAPGARAGLLDIPFEAEFVLVTVSSVAEHLTRDHVAAPDLSRWADTIAAMLSDRLGL